MRPRSRRLGTAQARNIRPAAATACLTVGVWLVGCGDRDTPRPIYDLIESLAVARVDTERAVLDVGASGTRPHLERGFSWSERAADGHTFAWSDGESSVALFELHSTEARRVVLRGLPFSDSRPGRTPEVTVRLNEELLGTLALEPANATYTLEAPQEVLRLGTNVLELRYGSTSRAQGQKGRAIAVAWDALALLQGPDAADAPARLDAELAALHQAARPPPVVHRGVLYLPPGRAVSWTLDLGPGAELVIGLGDPTPIGGPRLSVWLTSDNGDTTPLGEIESAGGARFSLPLERFGTVRLSMTALPADGHAGAWKALVVDEARIYAVSSPSASLAGSR